MTRQYKIKDDKIKGLLEKKEKTVNEGKVLATEYGNIEEELKKVGLRLQKVKDKIIPLVKGCYKDMDLTETEDVTSVAIVDGEVVAEITDAVAFYKENYLKQKYEKPKTENTGSKGADSGAKAK